MGVGLSSVRKVCEIGAAALLMLRAVTEGTLGLKNTLELAKNSFWF
jgi:hypothetical protein